MNLIIRTRRSQLGRFADLLITAVGWLAFSYLVARGVLAVINGIDHSMEVTFMGSALMTTQTLMLYLTIAAINALLLMLWGTYRRRMTRTTPDGAANMDDTMIAQGFSLSNPQLEDIRLSRQLVIHHADSGEIDRWECADTSHIRLSA